MVKVYSNRTEDLKLYFGFGEDSNPPEDFDFLFEISDVQSAVITTSALLLMEAEMTYKQSGALDYCRKGYVNFKEIGEHLAAYELGNALKKMLTEAKALCGTEAK